MICALGNLHLHSDLIIKPTVKRPLGWEDNIRIDLKEIGINTRNWWVDLTEDRDYWRLLVN